MDRVQNSAVDEPQQQTVNDEPNVAAGDPLERNKPNPFRMNGNDNSVDDEDADAPFRYPHEIYSREANWRDTNGLHEQMANDWHAEAHKRVRRAPPRPKEENKNTCSLYIQTDPLIWRHVREGIADVSFKICCAFLYIIAVVVVGSFLLYLCFLFPFSVFSLIVLYCYYYYSTKYTTNTHAYTNTPPAVAVHLLHPPPFPFCC